MEDQQQQPKVEPSRISRVLIEAPKEGDIYTRNGTTKKDRVWAVARHTGIVWGSATGVASFSAVTLATLKSPWFKARTNVSARMALGIMPAAFVWSWKTEQTMHRANINPREYKIGPPDATALEEYKVPEVGGVKALANWIYKNPVGFIGLSAVPIVGGSFYHINRQSRLRAARSISDQLMHTRTVAQFWVIVSLGATAAFHALMEWRGGAFRAEGAEEAEKGKGKAKGRGRSKAKKAKAEELSPVIEQGAAAV